MSKRFPVSCLIALVVSAALTVPVGASIPVDISEEYTDGVYIVKDQYGFNTSWYAVWVNVSGSEMLYITGLSWSTMFWFAGFHYHTTNGSNLFIGNMFSAFDVFKDSNGNGIADASNSQSGTYEVERYLANFTIYERTLHRLHRVDISGLSHYRWGVSFAGDALGMPTSGCLGWNGCNASDIFRFYFSNLTFYYDYYVNASQAHLKIGFEFIPIGTYAQLSNLGLAAGYSSTVLLVSQTGDPGDCQTVIDREHGVYSLCAGSSPNSGGALDNLSVKVGSGKVFEYFFGGNYVLTTNGANSTHASTASVIGPGDDAPAMNSPEALVNQRIMENRTRDYASLVIPNAERLNLTYNYATTLYRISYPTWSGGIITHDPEMIAYLVAQPAGTGTNPPTAPPSFSPTLLSFLALIGGSAAVVAVYLVRRRGRMPPRAVPAS